MCIRDRISAPFLSSRATIDRLLSLTWEGRQQTIACEVAGNLRRLQNCLGASHGCTISLSVCFISPRIDVLANTQALSRDYNVATATLLASLVLTRQTGTRAECFDWTVAATGKCRLLRKWRYCESLRKDVKKPVGFVEAP